MGTEKKRRKSSESGKDSLLGENKYLAKLAGDNQFRLRVIAAFGGQWNLLYAIYHLALAWAFRSYWFLTMGVYYLTVCFMRAFALHLKADGTENPKEWKTVRKNAVLTFALAVIFSGVVCLTIVGKQNQTYSTAVAVSMAAYTFYCVVLAAMNLIRKNEERSIQEILLRNCSLVYALGSLFGLERMLLGTFGSAEDEFTLMMEAVSGGGIFLIIVLFGVNLLLLAFKTKRYNEKESR